MEKSKKINKQPSGLTKEQVEFYKQKNGGKSFDEWCAEKQEEIEKYDGFFDTEDYY